MYRKIVVATDGSARSRRVAKVAGDLISSRLHCELYVLYVVHELPPEVMAMLKEANILYNSHMTDSANDILHQTVKAMLLDDDQIRVEAVRRHGNPANEIVKLAKEVEADLIIVGDSNISAVEEFLTRAGTSHKVLHNAPCDVLVVK